MSWGLCRECRSSCMDCGAFCKGCAFDVSENLKPLQIGRSICCASFAAGSIDVLPLYSQQQDMRFVVQQPREGMLQNCQCSKNLMTYFSDLACTQPKVLLNSQTPSYVRASVHHQALIPNYGQVDWLKTIRPLSAGYINVCGCAPSIELSIAFLIAEVLWLEPIPEM